MIARSRSSLLLRSTFVTAVVSSLSIGQLKSADDDGKKEEEVRLEQQLKMMRRSAELYTLSHADDGKRVFKFHEAAIMRFSNPVGSSRDGAIYLWTDRGQPQALFKIYTPDNEIFAHEWQSLSESPFVAEREGKTIWNPTEPGITFREMPDAPKPAESAAERLRQMKLLAGKFSVSYRTGQDDSKPEELRLLNQPLFRHEANAEAKRLDGAMFGFAQSTAPMGFLLFEARRDGESHRYYFAFARLSTQSMIAKLGDKEIYSVEKYNYRRDPTKTFLQLSKQPIPKE
jgi:hypothetical protein